MKLAIHQPCYIPYIGIFYKMYEADKFVFLDDAQYSNGYVFNWNTIKVSNGTCRLRIPIKYEFGDAINQVKMRKIDRFGIAVIINDNDLNFIPSGN